ncbi:MAG: type II methionyl aminopeptidase [Metallosphaera yellowstonensis]|jgi:methionine aminopeptidase, type II (EC 3.4.11.18)|uniref:Methionine aminopeptidase n=1 Tax=Metallosphaera yellowstonensis MK1 TaxID=671065 RepID=H2C8U3_9CREN|nr:type II methionyl aminopeptidase [Metallosphaera yellowstonensis]EHP68569.1 methionine aminopeptidase, type II [Metallosphaera yellowstonensis MK1]
MSEDELKLVKAAGVISAKARDAGAKLIKPGARVIDVCETVEKIIIESGARPAFPCNLSINNEAAHYSPVIGDEKIIPDGAIVKLDVGAHIEGYITDTAITVFLDEKLERLATASRDALTAAISNFRPGVSLADIGKIIERVIKMNGFKPIRNLGGHLIRRFELHAGVFVPNIYERTSGRIASGSTYAIEPFATDGGGEVIEGKETTIYALRNPNSRGLTEFEKRIVDEIQRRFKTLPFSERWLSDLGTKEEIRQALKSLSRKGVLHGYPILVEVKGGLVSQAEHTVYVDSQGATILT